MTLHISVLPASTQAGKETINALLRSNKDVFVQAFYRDTAKAPSEFTDHSNFQAIKGDLSGDSEPDFRKSDAVFYIPPPTYDGTNTAEFATRGARKIKAALEKAPRVNRLVLFSAMGAEHGTGIGILKINHIAEEILKDSAREVVITKAGWFMENWVSAFETMKGEQPFFESIITPLDFNFPMISLQDIGEICAQKLLATGKSPLSSSPQVLELHGPRSYSSLDVKYALEKATGKKVNAVGIEPAALHDFYIKAVPEPYAQELVDMNLAMLPGGVITENLGKTGSITRGTTELVDSLRKIATGETTKAASGAF